MSISNDGLALWAYALQQCRGCRFKPRLSHRWVLSTSISDHPSLPVKANIARRHARPRNVTFRTYVNYANPHWFRAVDYGPYTLFIANKIVLFNINIVFFLQFSNNISYSVLQLICTLVDGSLVNFETFYWSWHAVYSLLPPSFYGNKKCC